MTTTETTLISNIQYCNIISSDEYLNFDELFSSSLDVIFNDEYDNDLISYDDAIKTEENEETSLTMINQCQIETSSTNNLPIEYHLPNLICRVCGSPAHGYNFDQITCESCKAFFRRNALKDMANIKCRFSGTCLITKQTRRQCTYCRLKKCFDIKMRKDWIRTEEERKLRRLQDSAREKKKSKKSINDKQPLCSYPIVIRRKKRLTAILEQLSIPTFNILNNFFTLNRNLSEDNRALLNNITISYQSSTNHIDGFRINKTAVPASLVEYLNGESVAYESLICFYKRIPEFKQLDLSDQILLIKRNQLDAMHVHYILVRNFQENLLVGKLMTKWVNAEFHQEMSRTRHYFDYFIEHPIILRLSLIVLVFSMSLSVPRYNDQFIDYQNQKKIYENQNYYISLLWHYLNHVFGEEEAIRSLQVIVTQTIRFQTLMYKFEQAIQRDRNRYTFNQLMQTIIQFK
ncbi:unnamed protein product [Adineta steineri]|uniref:Nuclear receptor domain-containing protein n=1 Tax=Adineta steineri TaxID=433720 RepID=A0A813VEE3_9BILA|nr:unnamed protein product [Adineta steineri]CAF4015338.1 unnamed protein product [Adineta steineri]